MEKVLTTLVFVIENNRILLAMKKRGFGEGWWNGFGGKVLPGEELAVSAGRETEEEANIQAKDLRQIGLLHFTLKNEHKQILCHVFVTDKYDGEPAETEEMRPQWFYFNEIPFDKMWADDRFWFPYMLEGKNFKGRFVFQKPGVLEDYEIEET